MATTAPTTAIGYTQAPQYSQLAYEDELTPELQWPQSITVYDQMRKTDSQVASVLRAVTLPVRRTPWRIDPNGARGEVVELVADDLGLPIVGQAPRTPPRQKDRFSWSEHLRLALLMLPMGASYFEQVYRIEDDASRAHLRKLEWRPMKTIDDIQVAQDGGLVSIKQCWTQINTSPKPIPVSRLVAYVHEREGGGWLGSSILRSAYKNWLLKDRLLRVQAQTIERNGMGIPVYEAAETEASLTAGLNMAKSLRAGEAAGAATPYGAKLRLMGVEGTLPDADPAIKYHDESIARAVLAHFLNLGTQTGSWALGTTFVDFFTMSLQTLAYQIADVANKHIIEDLVDVNFGEQEPAPRLVFDEIGSRQQATAQAIKLLVDAGLITPDQVLDETLRQQYGLPPADPATAKPAPTQGEPSRAPEPEPVPGEGSVAASAGDGDPKEGAVAAAESEPEPVIAHLPGKHNQADHGRRKGASGIAPGDAPEAPRKRTSGVRKAGPSSLTPSQAQAMQDEMMDGDRWSRDEKNALRDYAAFGYREMNGVLRGNYRGGEDARMTRAEAKAAVKLANGALRPLPKAVQVHRGLSFEAIGLPEPVTIGDILDRDANGLQLVRDLKGKTLQERGFMSTTVDANSAFPSSLALVVEVPAGTRAAYIAKIADEPDEAELLLEPGLKYEILDVEERPGKSPLVRARVAK